MKKILYGFILTMMLFGGMLNVKADVLLGDLKCGDSEYSVKIKNGQTVECTLFAGESSGNLLLFNDATVKIVGFQDEVGTKYIDLTYRFEPNSALTKVSENNGTYTLKNENNKVKDGNIGKFYLTFNNAEKIKHGVNFSVIVKLNGEDYSMDISRDFYNEDNVYEIYSEGYNNDTSLHNIIIENYNIDFNKDKKEYNLNINKEDKLDIVCSTNDSKAKYEIKGNENLKDGSKIEIIVTATNGATDTYVINIKKEESLDTSTIAIIGLSAVVVILLSYVIYINLNKKKVY